MKKLSAEIALLLMMFTAADVYPQLYEQQYDTAFTNNFLSTDLVNEYNAASLKARLNVQGIREKFKYSITNQFFSDVTKLTENFARDNNNLKVDASYSVTRKLYAGLGVQSFSLSDNKDIELNKGYNNFYYASVDYEPFSSVTLISRLGLKGEEQIGQKNTGPAGYLESRLRNLNIQGFITNGGISLSHDRLSEKTNYSYEINTNVKKTFTENSKNTAFVRAYTYRSDFYTPATTSILEGYNVKNNIQSRFEEYAYLGDELDYRFSKIFKVQLNGFYLLKNIKNTYKYKPATNIITENIYDYKVNENLLQAGIKGELNSGRLYSRVELAYNERNEVHNLINAESLSQAQKRELERIEKDKNNNSRSSYVLLEAYYTISNTQLIRFSGSSSLLKYDTDSEQNSDDRDELAINGMLTHRYDNLRNFNIETSFEYNTGVLNYLFKEKSSNNNTNRIYKLTSRSSFVPSTGLVTKNLFQVLANYTVYKYEDLLSQVQSFSFRQLYLYDSTTYDLTKELKLNLHISLRFYEQGQYNERNFSVKPIAYFDERNIQTGIIFRIKDFIFLSTGFKHFIQRQYIYDKSEKSLRRTYAAYGPVAGIYFRLARNSHIELNGGLDYIKASDNTLTSLSKNLIISILWNL